jgi:hypothetical protein
MAHVLRQRISRTSGRGDVSVDRADESASRPEVLTVVVGRGAESLVGERWVAAVVQTLAQLQLPRGVGPLVFSRHCRDISHRYEHVQSSPSALPGHDTSMTLQRNALPVCFRRLRIAILRSWGPGSPSAERTIVVPRFWIRRIRTMGRVVTAGDKVRPRISQRSRAGVAARVAHELVAECGAVHAYTVGSRR